ncbi:uncharacterized protein J3R85_015387 [Psidium guajava]|nr:uncharacterized protein J3R85_015387 [Psidium guajava]
MWKTRGALDPKDHRKRLGNVQHLPQPSWATDMNGPVEPYALANFLAPSPGSVAPTVGEKVKIGMMRAA